ncbi:hypothetical protein BDV23DRAFT_160823 [Aspergillus alliaceus]|uniref:Uncharacterized protein n=1 Tax=Petromyces alliaceus TaxID=209559 RepID=A0A5N7C0Y2_PETAA|nr:hypothetical protein BDV23DRAFT_160823 [Aspergillus alliaceus]
MPRGSIRQKPDYYKQSCSVKGIPLHVLRSRHVIEKASLSPNRHGSVRSWYRFTPTIRSDGSRKRVKKKRKRKKEEKETLNGDNHKSTFSSVKGAKKFFSPSHLHRLTAITNVNQSSRKLKRDSVEKQSKEKIRLRKIKNFGTHQKSDSIHGEMPRDNSIMLTASLIDNRYRNRIEKERKKSYNITQKRKPNHWANLRASLEKEGLQSIGLRPPRDSG